MRISSTIAILALSAAFVAAGCSGPDTADDDVPTEEPTEETHDHDEETHDVDEHLDDEDHDHDDDEAEEEEFVGQLGMIAIAEVHTGEGEVMGEVTFTQTRDGVEVEGFLEGLDEGPKGFHVHEYGECEPPDFMSAGGHFNPTDAPHGGPHDDHDERHAGDFGNIEFDEEGVAEFNFVDDKVTLGEGETNIVGQSLIVHYEEDDLVSQPVGEAGARAGCGIIEETRGGVY